MHRAGNTARVSGCFEKAATFWHLGDLMIVVGIVLLLLTALLDLPPVLWTIGLILIIAGAVLWIFGSMGRTVGPRRHYW
jgi:flagellar biosynthesis component FlhA